MLSCFLFVVAGVRVCVGGCVLGNQLHVSVLRME